MSTRIQELEDALAIVQAATTSEPHPLLSKDFLAVKLPPDTQNAGVGAEKVEEKNENTNAGVVDDGLALELGLLTLGAHGKMKYLGRNAKVEVCHPFASHTRIANPDRLTSILSLVQTAKNLSPNPLHPTWDPLPQALKIHTSLNSPPKSSN